jgi:hypothetical protein
MWFKTFFEPYKKYNLQEMHEIWSDIEKYGDVMDAMKYRWWCRDLGDGFWDFRPTRLQRLRKWFQDLFPKPGRGDLSLAPLDAEEASLSLCEPADLSLCE